MNNNINLVKLPAVVLIVGIICITILEGLAVWKEIDGKCFSLAVGAICLICGVTITKVFRVGIK